MPASRLHPLRCLVPALALVLLSACAPRSDNPAPDSNQAGPASNAASPARPARLIGPAFTLVDTLGRPLECVILAKDGSRVLVKRTSDQARYLIDFDRLSAATQQLLASYPDDNARELENFVHERDYTEARRTIRVEMIATTWSGDCLKAKKFFAIEGINYTAYDPESMQGKERRKSWGNDTLPAVKIGGQVIGGFDQKAYVDALLSAYRQQLATAPRP